MKVFVTGGTGFLGRHLIDELLARDCEVTALVRTFDRARSLPPAVRTLAGDVTQPSALRSGMRGAEVIFHLAAWTAIGVRPKDYPRLARINVDGTRQVLELAAELGGPLVVYTSALDVYGDTRGQLVGGRSLPRAAPPESEYARSKYRALVDVVALMQARGLPLIVICPGAIYGPGDLSNRGRLLQRYALNRLPVMLGGETAHSWTHVADVAAGHWLAATQGRPGQTYFLAGPAHTYRELFAAAERATGLPAPRVWLPGSLARFLARLVARVRPSLAERLRSVSGLTFLAGSDQAQRELGWQARSLDAGLPETIRWYTQQDRQAREAARVPPPLEA